MTHLGYIVAAYGVALAAIAGFSVAAWLRLGQARRRLAAVDTRERER